MPKCLHSGVKVEDTMKFLVGIVKLFCNEDFKWAILLLEERHKSQKKFHKIF